MQNPQSCVVRRPPPSALTTARKTSSSPRDHQAMSTCLNHRTQEDWAARHQGPHLWERHTASPSGVWPPPGVATTYGHIASRTGSTRIHSSLSPPILRHHFSRCQFSQSLCTPHPTPRTPITTASVGGCHRHLLLSSYPRGSPMARSRAPQSWLSQEREVGTNWKETATQKSILLHSR